MCTRYSCHLSEIDLTFLGFGKVSLDDPIQQVSPGRQVWIIRQNDQGSPELVKAKWGLAPSWLRDFSKVQANARVETANELTMFKESWRKRRCLFLADSYFQWRAESDNRRQLWRIGVQNQPFLLMAGLWERFQVDDTLSFDSCAVLTMPATEQLSLISERMPAVIHRDYAREWLSGGAFDTQRFNTLAKKTVFHCQSLVKR